MRLNFFKCKFFQNFWWKNLGFKQYLRLMLPLQCRCTWSLRCRAACSRLPRSYASGLRRSGTAGRFWGQHICPSLESRPLPEQSISQLPASGLSSSGTGGWFWGQNIGPPWNYRLSLNNQSVSYQLQDQVEVEPLENFEANKLAPPWNHHLSQNNQSVNHRLQDQEKRGTTGRFWGHKLPLLGITASPWTIN